MNAEPENTPASAMRTAAYSSDSPTVRRLIQEAVDTNVADRWGRTALSLAAGQGHLGVVEILLAAGACVDPYEDYTTYETPLIAAAENGHMPVLRALIAAGANPRLHAGPSQATAEHYARVNGYSAISEYLRTLIDG